MQHEWKRSWHGDANRGAKMLGSSGAVGFKANKVLAFSGAIIDHSARDEHGVGESFE